MSNREHPKSTSPGLRLLLLFIGLSSTLLAIVGIFLPLLPTVPLLLLAAACFARSSERFHRWLLEHPRLGPMIADYLDGQGIPLRSKIVAISLIWVSISISLIFLASRQWLQIVLLVIGLSLSYYLIRLPLRNEK